jgi:hypothetical protein
VAAAGPAVEHRSGHCMLRVCTNSLKLVSSWEQRCWLWCSNVASVHAGYVGTNVSLLGVLLVQDARQLSLVAIVVPSLFPGCWLGVGGANLVRRSVCACQSHGDVGFDIRRI